MTARVEVRADTGHSDTLEIDAGDVAHGPSLAALLREWGESVGAAVVWFRVGGQWPGTLDIENPAARPQEVM